MTARLTLGGDKLSDHGRGAAALLLEGDLGDDDVVLEDGAAAGADCVAASLVVLYVRSATLRADARHFLQLMHTNGKVPSQHLFCTSHAQFVCACALFLFHTKTHTQWRCPTKGQKCHRRNEVKLSHFHTIPWNSLIGLQPTEDATWTMNGNASFVIYCACRAILQKRELALHPQLAR